MLRSFFGPLCRIRTCDPQNRNLILYPAELRAVTTIINAHNYITSLRQSKEYFIFL